MLSFSVMVAAKSQCDPQLLRQLLDDQLPQESQDAMAKHLESCATCRLKLEALAADPDWWSDAQQLLNTATYLEEPTSISNVLTPGGVTSGSAAGSRLRFLSPVEDPTKLGRLGPYEIIKVIGQGGMGIVLKGYDSALNRHVAIKVLAPQWMHSIAARQRFAREARAAAAVVHEHVIAIHAVDSANEVPYLVMPFVDGKSLQERIDQDGPLQLKEILHISIQIAAGLAAAHAQGLVHRDIKPANILLENGKQRVVITDFGLARAVDDASFTRSCFLIGTPEYMAPEQANGEFVDHRTDLFCLGSVMYALCTGTTPFHAETTMAVLRRICEGEYRPIQDINPSIPAWLVQIIARLHAKNPAERFQTAGEVAQLLKQWLDHLEQPVLHPRPRYPARGWRGLTVFPRRIVQPRWAVASALLLVTAALITFETTGKTHLLRWILDFSQTPTEIKLPEGTVPPPPNMPSGRPSGAEITAYQDTLFSRRIADLWQQVQELTTTFSAGESSGTPPDAVTRVSSQLAELQAELPEKRRNAETEQIRQIAAAIDQLKQSPPRPENGGGIDAKLMEINTRIEQLNQDLYRNFP
jgi:serine/threonine protein kinase